MADDGPRLRWPRRVRLLKRSEFQNVYSAGTKHSSPFFQAFLLRTGTGETRVGFTAPRALGSAVRRNRIKRRLREALRLHLPEAGRGWHIVVNARRAALDAPFERVEQEVCRLLRATGGKPGKEQA